MPQATKKDLLLLLIFGFAFIYRLMLMMWNGFPPGADIGLHNSVVYSITNHGNVDFLYNFYHMGGGISLTFPGYHIFTSSIMMLTDLPEYVAQAAVVALFSSLLVVCAFLITKRVWSNSAAFIVALLISVSRFDIEMLMWAGYPNVITLLLIPVTFYLYLEKDRFTKVPFLVSTSILISSLFLTHSLSAVMFVGIAVVTMLVTLAFPNSVGVARKTALYWILPIILGAVLVSPFLVSALPTYLAQYGSDEITTAIIASRILPLEVVLPLFLITLAFFAYAKKFYNKTLALPALLFAMWVFLPLILTQGYLVGLPVDYNRFLYFLVLPVLVFIAVSFDYLGGILAESLDSMRAQGKLRLKKISVPKRLQKFQKRILDASSKTSKSLTKKRIYTILVLVFLLVSIEALPIFTSVQLEGGFNLKNYYQTMDNHGWNALQWIKTNTPSNSVLVSDALYGWWLGGFSQRQTLSAVSPEYLTVKREVDNASFARNLMDTDYIIDNGLIQIREDGYLARHIPEVLIDQNWTYATYSFFTFGNQTQVLYNDKAVLLQDLPVKEMHVINGTDQASIIVTRGNSDLDFTVTTTVYRGVRFANITSTITALSPDVSLDWVSLWVVSNGAQVYTGKPKTTIAMIDNGVKALGQLIFEQTPVNEPRLQGGLIEIQYHFAQNSTGTFGLLAGAYPLDNDSEHWINDAVRNAYFAPEIANNLASPLTPIKNAEEPEYDLTVFDYRLELQKRQVDFIVCRDQAVIPKFLNDPSFSRVFINPEVAIFKVHR
jgi:hypothetical protein